MLQMKQWRQKVWHLKKIEKSIKFGGMEEGL